jgi:hypothetical protein
VRRFLAYRWGIPHAPARPSIEATSAACPLRGVLVLVGHRGPRIAEKVVAVECRRSQLSEMRAGDAGYLSGYPFAFGARAGRQARGRDHGRPGKDGQIALIARHGVEPSYRERRHVRHGHQRKPITSRGRRPYTARDTSPRGGSRPASLADTPTQGGDGDASHPDPQTACGDASFRQGPGRPHHADWKRRMSRCAAATLRAATDASKGYAGHRS